MSQFALPGKPEEITPEWFTVIFRESSLLNTGKVIGVQTEPIGQDRGFTGVIVRAQLQYTDHEENLPRTVIIKMPMADRDASSAYRASQEKDATAARRYLERCARELAFYQHIAPQISLPVPRFYYGAADDPTGRVILVLEDLHSARPGDALHGCSRQDATLVVEQLARFHAQWWNHLQPHTFSWLPLWGGDEHTAQKRYLQCIGPFLQQFGSRVPIGIRPTIDALTTNYGAVRAQMKQSPTTLIHADLHLDNILFAPSSYEPGITVIDWQSVVRGRGAIDLALFLFGSLEMSIRQSIEDDLLRRYHELLLGEGVTGYNFSQLRKDCRLVLLWLLGAKVVWLGSIDIEKLSGREQALVDASLAEDSFAPLLDYDVASLLPL